MAKLLIHLAKFFTFGALLALSAPYIGVMIGLAPNTTDAAWELGKMGNPWLAGGAFTALAGLDAALKPLFKKLFKSPPQS